MGDSVSGEETLCAHRARERGQTVLMVTFLILAMFGVLGLACDLGWAYYVRMSARASADAAALGSIEAAMQSAASGASITCGANGIACHSDPAACGNPPTSPPANNLDNGCLYAQANSFTASGNQNVTMQAGVSSTVPTAPGISNAQYWVSVRVSQRIPQLFSAVLGNSTLNVTARASAAVVPAYGGGCIYVLEPTGQNAFVSSGSANVHAPCGIYVNSSDDKAIQVTGGACVNASPAGIYVVGNDNGSDSCVAPAPAHTDSFSDPLAGLTEPTFPTSCDHTNESVSGSQTLTPGVYCGGITVSGGASATFNSGLYIMIGGGLVSSGTSNLSGTNVTFYNTACGSGYTHTTCPSGSGSYNGSYRPYVISGGGTGTLSAPVSGPYNNILLMQDRTVPIQSSQETVSGTSVATLIGVVYLPRSPLVYSGGSSTTSPNITLISWTLTFSGPSYLQSGLNGSTGGGTGARVAMVE